MGQELRQWQDILIIYVRCYTGKILDNLTNYQVITVARQMNIRSSSRRVYLGISPNKCPIQEEVRDVLRNA